MRWRINVHPLQGLADAAMVMAGWFAAKANWGVAVAFWFISICLRALDETIKESKGGGGLK